MTRNDAVTARKEPRAAVRLFGNLKYMNAELRCRVIDLSADGIGLRLEEPREICRGVPVTFNGPELGFLDGTVTWANSNTVGLKLKHTSSTYAQVASYFRFFHEDTGPAART